MRFLLGMALILSVFACDAMLDGSRADIGNVHESQEWLIVGDYWRDDVRADIRFYEERLQELRRFLEESESCEDQCPPGCWCQPLPNVHVITE